MLPELGNLALVTALVVAIMLSIMPLAASFGRLPAWVGFARPATLTQLLLVGFAYACLTAAFLSDDFSVAYVAGHSNTQLPLIYKISGVWGGHEGSMLLWIFILSLWSGAVAIFTRRMPDILVARVLAVMGMISAGLLLFSLFTSNPFARLIAIPPEGRSLNPILQDIGLAIHPPMLYMGYVGFSVAFAFAVAAMIGGRLDAAWARWSRPWTNVAWSFLTVGIALGSWWAYYELGWGGWWFWDPVENASFMPWLMGTALIHSLAATEKRGVLKAWSLLLAIMTFALSLLGTFLVRSGVLTSVHAFANDPARGFFILVFLGLVVGASLLLYAWRAPGLVSRVQFAPVSRESSLLVNNIFLCVLCFSVLLGTLYPLLHDAIGAGKLSVGAPYFNTVFLLLGAPLAMLVGIGALLRWKTDHLSRIAPGLLPLLLGSLLLGLSMPLLMPHYSVRAGLGATAGIWIMLINLAALWQRTSDGSRWADLRTASRAFYGMLLAHAGVGVFLIGVTFTSEFSVQKDIRMQASQSVEVGGYRFLFTGVARHRGPNYTADLGTIEVYRDGQPVAALKPEKRLYLAQRSPTTEAAIDAGFSRDLYVALGQPIGADGAWSVRIYYKPFIRWIWLGALIMALGGLLAASDQRYRNQPRRQPVGGALPAAA